MSDHSTATYEPPGTGLDDDLDDLPPRPRRRITRLTVGLVALLLVAAGFVAGAAVQKHAGGDTAQTAGGLPGAAAVRAAGGAGGQPGGAGATTGTVTVVDGSTLYVTGADGTTFKVRAVKGATVTRTVKSKAKQIRPGETVVLQGSKAKGGTFKATSIRASLPGSNGGTSAVDQLFSGGGDGG